MNPTQKGHDSRATTRLILRLVRAFPRRALKVTVLLVFSGLAEGVGILSILPLLQLAGGRDAESGLGQLVEDSIHSIGLDLSVGLLLVVLIAGILLKAGLVILATREAGYAAADLAMQLRLDLISALMRARWGLFAGQPAGSLANAMSDEAKRASSIFLLVGNLLAGAVQIIVYGTLAFFVAWDITLAAIVFSLAMLASLNSLVRRARLAGKAQTQSLKTLVWRFTDAMGNMKSLRAMGKESALDLFLRRESASLNAAQRQQVQTSSALNALQEPLAAIFLAIALYGALRYTSLQWETLLFMAILFQRTVSRFGGLQVQYQRIADVESAYWSIKQAIESARAEQEVHRGKTPPQLQKCIRFEAVSFSYGETPVLDDLTFEIDAGSFTSIVGPSGVGKTTIVDLIIGLHTPAGGTIYLDDIPLSDVDMRAWRAMIGYVPQEIGLFHDSVYMNISLGDEEIDETQVERALVAAGAWTFTQALPQGMHTSVGEKGLRLSGGQRQRIAIARALVHDPTLLILDEATSALDPVTEMEICETLQGLSGITILAISHQNALVDSADTVMEMSPIA